MSHLKGHFMYIFIVDPYLMVSEPQVDLCSSDLIEQVIDPREWVTVLDGHLVKLAVIDAHSHHTILLLYENYQCYPFSINSYNCSLSSTNFGALMR